MTRPTVAVLGASANRRKFGNKAVRAYLQQGYDVYPVSPNGQEIEGLKVYASLADVPAPLDRITIYLPARVTIDLVDAIAAAGAKEVWLNPGAERDDLVAALKARGIQPIQACSILTLGQHPGDLD